jgi:hypothetical protein
MATQRKASKTHGNQIDLTRAIAAIFAFAGFTMSTASGFLSGADAQRAITNAVVSLAVCYVVGVLCGGVVVRVIQEHNDDYEKSNPVPDVDGLLRESNAPVEIEPEPDEPAPTGSGPAGTAKKL